MKIAFCALPPLYSAPEHTLHPLSSFWVLGGVNGLCAEIFEELSLLHFFHLIPPSPSLLSIFCC